MARAWHVGWAVTARRRRHIIIAALYTIATERPSDATHRRRPALPCPALHTDTPNIDRQQRRPCTTRSDPIRSDPNRPDPTRPDSTPRPDHLSEHLSSSATLSHIRFVYNTTPRHDLAAVAVLRRGGWGDQRSGSPLPKRNFWSV